MERVGYPDPLNISQIVGCGCIRRWYPTVLPNSRLEGTNSKIRIINHRGYGHHSAEALTAMIYLCCSAIDIELPWQ
jgi:hypothetical protein